MSSSQAQYNSPCPGFGKPTPGHRHSSRCRQIIVTAKHKPFDMEAWKRVLIAYTYHIHDQNVKEQKNQNHQPLTDPDAPT